MQYLRAGVSLCALYSAAAAAPLAHGAASAGTPTAAGANCQAESLQPLLLNRSDLAGFKLAVCDDFLGDKLDSKLWSYNFTWGDSSQLIGKTTEFNFNAAFDPALVTEAGGNLVLSATNHPAASAIDHPADGSSKLHRMPDNFCNALKGGNWSACNLDYSTGAVTSRFKFRYGYLEGRFRLPDTHGFWPAFWLLNSGWPPETDILELLTNKAADGTYRYYLSQTYHYRNPGGGDGSSGRGFNNYDLQWLGLCADAASGSCGQQLSTAFHVFGVEWTPRVVNFYIDGRLTHSFTDASRITDQEAYVLINLGVGGWAESPNSTTDWSRAQMQVDWVRLWTLPNEVGTFTVPAQ